MHKIAVLIFCLLIGIGVLTVGYEAYDRHQRRLLVFAAIDPEFPDINLSELRSLRNLLEKRLEGLDKEIREVYPELYPGSLEIVVFPYPGSPASYLALVYFQKQALGFTVMDSRDLWQAAERAAFDIRVSVAVFLALQRHQLQRPGLPQARALFSTK